MVIHKKFVVKRSTAGLGLFANKDFTKGEFVVAYTGPILSNDEANAKGGRYLFKLTNNKTIDGSKRSNLARYINHSCKPNCEPVNEDNKRIIIQAKRFIKKGEELTYNYGKEYTNEFCNPCLCEACQKGKV